MIFVQRRLSTVAFTVSGDVRWRFPKDKDGNGGLSLEEATCATQGQQVIAIAAREKTFEPVADLPYAFPTGGLDGG